MPTTNNLFRDGILMDVNVRFWSGSFMLTPEDMGLKESDVSEAFKLGKKMLIPESVIHDFRTIEGRARRIVTENSFAFPIANARFVPSKKINDVIQELSNCQTEYNALTANLITNYDRYKADMEPIFRLAAELAYTKQMPTGVQEFSIDDMETKKQAFITNFMTRINALYPVRESLSGKFSLTWDIYEIGVASEIATEEYRIQAREKIKHFVDEVVFTLRTETLEICNRITKNIHDGKIVRGRTLISLREYIDKFSEMNFVGDTTVEEQLNNLKSEFLNVHEDKAISDNADLQTELHRRLAMIVEKVSGTTDINAITGQYRRKLCMEE